MSRLDELKNGNQSQSLDIDMTADIDGINKKEPEKISMGNGKKVITPNGNSPLKRRRLDPVELSEKMAADREESQVMDESDYLENSIKNPDAYANNILNGKENLLDKWKREKIQEYQDRMAQFDEEREELIEEGVLDPKDIKDPDYIAENGIVNDDEDEDEEIEDDEVTSTSVGNNAELVLDDDDLFGADEDDEIKSDEDDEYPFEDADEEDGEEYQDEDKEEVEHIVHITEEDREVFDSVGGDVDSSRFLDDEEDEEEDTTEDNSSDDEDSEDTTETEDRSEETLRHLKKLITDKLNPTFKKINISDFKVVTKKGNSNIKNITDNRQLKVVKWVLPNQKQCVFMKQFSGLELQTLSENIQDGSLTSMNIAYRSIYDHIVSNKPKKFTDWLACTPDSDIDHYMFCIFIASYKGSNYLPLDCPNDNCPDPTFLTDDIPIMDMVKFADDDAKDRFMEIYKSEIVYSNRNGYYTSVVTPVSNQIAIEFKESTIKDAIDVESLDERFRTKYGTIVNIIPYIDNIYEIDYNTGELIKINYTETDNGVKTLRGKIRKYAKLIDTLSSDEFGVITAIIQDIAQRDSMMSYIIPEVECPACGRKINETPTTATQLVFTRYQLGALVNTTLN